MAEENKMNTNEGFINFQIVGGNKEGFSKYQNNKVLVARMIYHMVGAPNLRKFKTMVRQNSIQNFPVTIYYIDMEEKIFCTDLYNLKVTPTMQSPDVVVDNFIEIPRELIENIQELILCM